MKLDPLLTLFDVLIGGPLIVIAAVLMSLLFSATVMGALGRALMRGLLTLHKSSKTGVPQVAVSSSHH